MFRQNVISEFRGKWFFSMKNKCSTSWSFRVTVIAGRGVGAKIVNKRVWNNFRNFKVDRFFKLAFHGKIAEYAFMCSLRVRIVFIVKHKEKFSKIWISVSKDGVNSNICICQKICYHRLVSFEIEYRQGWSEIDTFAST